VVIFFLSTPIRRQYRAQHDVNELLLALKAYQITFGNPPQGSVAQICASLRGNNPTKEPVVESYTTNDSGEFIDPWGMPYRFSMASKFSVYSCGPNKADDQGRGDDIIAQ
jgi:hypothetical protein